MIHLLGGGGMDGVRGKDGEGREQNVVEDIRASRDLVDLADIEIDQIWQTVKQTGSGRQRNRPDLADRQQALVLLYS